MKILQICHKPPCPPVDGGCLASYALSKGIVDAKIQLHLFTMETEKHPVLNTDELQHFKSKALFTSVFVDTRIQVLDGIVTWLRGRSYHIQRFYSKKVEKELKKLLLSNTYEVVILESLFATPYLHLIRKHTNAKVVLRQHNIEYTIWNRLATHDSSFFKRCAIRLLIPSLKRYEKKMMQKVDATFFISEVDKKYAVENHKISNAEVLPFGIDLHQYEVAEKAPAKNFFHLGSMSWLPNREGIDYFLTKIFPRFITQFPEATFKLAGRETQDYFSSDEEKGMMCEGEVDNAKVFMQENGVLVVPLLSGSGVRIKIIEAMAMGKAVITTPVGAEGLEVSHGENILIAATEEEWLECLTQCWNNEKLCKKLGSNARKYVENYHNNKQIMEEFIEKLDIEEEEL